MEKLKLKVSGRVQGVGFRYVTQSVATEMGVRGEVWNNADASVTIRAQAEDLSAFVNQVRTGYLKKPWIKVTDVSVQFDNDAPDFDDFKVVYK
ncbi:MAG: acylphosphatase [Streptococcaceae bacterium]|jgi:acylphosphatase|nr:acylphosphatase [Streptococcaceae bacterium]